MPLLQLPTGAREQCDESAVVTMSPVCVFELHADKDTAVMFDSGDV